MTISGDGGGRVLQSPGRRIVAAVLLLLITLAVIAFFAGNWSFLGDGSPFNLLFVSAALLLVLGAYVTEPFFTKPVDVIVNAVAALVTLLGVRDKAHFIGFVPLLGASLVLLVLAIFVAVVPVGRFGRLKHVLFRLVTQAGSSAAVFAAVYLLVLVSFFTAREAEFWGLLTLLLLLTIRRPVERIVNFLFSLGRSRPVRSGFVGKVGARLNPYLLAAHREGSGESMQGKLVAAMAAKSTGAVGVVLYEVFRADGLDVVVELVKNGDRVLGVDLQNNSIRDLSPTESLTGDVFLIASPDVNGHAAVAKVAKGLASIVGYVAPQSSIETLLVEIPEALPGRAELEIGSVVSVDVRGKSFNYQVIAAHLDEERLTRGDARGFTVFRAQPLGYYDATQRELSPAQWVPDIYSPVRLLESRPPERVADDAIGYLPNTSMEIPIANADELVTHNTAVLGILGIGKSSLTFELIQKSLTLTDTRVLCIDITNEYAAELPNYTAETISADTVNAFDSINASYESIVDGNVEASGSVGAYRAAVRLDLLRFLFDNDSIPVTGQISGSARIRVMNPDYHKVSRGEKLGYKLTTSDLTQAEKTRVITEQLFWILRELGPSQGKARVVVVLEEAHSLVPEWNATAQDADRGAVNGTAKVILQGRKFGMGSFIVTQRTAHVSKSILNQCNTIFAMRIFDDTGKQFLENYVGQRYASALPTLEERHAIAVGRALRLKQPVIIRLNDSDAVRIPRAVAPGISIVDDAVPF